MSKDTRETTESLPPDEGMDSDRPAVTEEGPVAQQEPDAADAALARATRRQPTPLRVVSIEMADGSDINSPEAQVRIARALLGIRAPVTPESIDTPDPEGGLTS